MNTFKKLNNQSSIKLFPISTKFSLEKKLLKNYLDKIKKTISQYKTEDLVYKIQIFESIDVPIRNGELEIKLQSGIHELTDLNTAIQQKLQFYRGYQHLYS